MPGPAIVRSGGIRLRVRLTPRGGRDAVSGMKQDAAGERMLAVRVAAPPVDGAANAALVALLARIFGVSKGAVRVAAGATARIKTVEIDGDSAVLAEIAGRLATEGA